MPVRHIVLFTGLWLLLQGCSAKPAFDLQKVIQHNTSIIDRNEQGQIMGLDLSGLPVTDLDLSHLMSIRSLKTIDLRGTMITDEGLEVLAKNQKLGEIGLTGTKVSPKSVEDLRNKLPNTYIYW